MKMAEMPRIESDPTFPKLAIRNGLAEFWNQQSKDRHEDPFHPVPKSNGTIHDLLPALDSLTVARSFNVVSKILKFKVPIKLVKKGGYASRNEMFEDLLPKLQELFNKRKNLTKLTT